MRGYDREMERRSSSTSHPDSFLPPLPLINSLLADRGISGSEGKKSIKRDRNLERSDEIQSERAKSTRERLNSNRKFHKVYSRTIKCEEKGRGGSFKITILTPTFTPE